MAEHLEYLGLPEVLVSLGLCEIWLLLFDFPERASFELHSPPLCAFIDHYFLVPLKWFAFSLEMYLCELGCNHDICETLKSWILLFFPYPCSWTQSSFIMFLKVDGSNWKSLSDLVYHPLPECQRCFVYLSSLCQSRLESCRHCSSSALLFLLVVDMVEGPKEEDVAEEDLPPVGS